MKLQSKLERQYGRLPSTAWVGLWIGFYTYLMVDVFSWLYEQHFAPSALRLIFGIS
ncbi:hypothetical protein [Chitinibacter tainanensis]|uniref:hypothetical protein n=1 Tax=Chitinibacter tainanensis TaxID=230667 RepID=UPI000424FA49|nr:hypothetical protein [Chitinibacter tainanensis]